MFIFFWVCFILGISFAILAILCQNTVYSILVLILLFITAATLLFLLNVEFLGFIFIIVYVGAIAVLFLFVVMLLNIRVQEVHTSVMRYWPWGGLFGFSCLSLLLVIFSFDLPVGYGFALGQLPNDFNLEAGAYWVFGFFLKVINFTLGEVIFAGNLAAFDKLFSVRIIYDTIGFLHDLVFDSFLMQICWFNLSSLFISVRDVLTVQDIHPQSLAWIGCTPHQFSYPVFFILCVRDFFVFFYTNLIYYLFNGSFFAPSSASLSTYVIWNSIIVPHSSVSSFPVCLQKLFGAEPFTLNFLELYPRAWLQGLCEFVPMELVALASVHNSVDSGAFFRHSWLSFTFEVELLTLLGRVLYEPFAAYFINAGLILFIALIGALVLTYKQDNSRKRLYLLRQVNGETKRLLLRLPSVVKQPSKTKDSNKQ